MKITILPIHLKFFFILFILHCTKVFAQTPQYSYVASTVTVNAYPLNDGANNRRTALQLSGEVGTVTGSIDTFYIRVDASKTVTYTDFTLLLGHTTATTAPTTWTTTGMDTVFYASNVTLSTITVGSIYWLPIPLTKPFQYNSAQNLLIDLSQNGYSSGLGCPLQNSGATARSRYGNRTATTTTSMDRAYCWGFTLNRILGSNNASVSELTAPKNFCGNSSQDIKVRLKNTGTNLLNNVTVQWTLDGVAQTPIAWNSPLDTFGSTLHPNDTIITLGSTTFGTAAKTLKAWTEYPNSVIDTVNADDTINVVMTPALNGTYTIGGVSANYPNISAAVNALTVAGVCGPVTFHVDSASGPYVGSVNFGNISGSSATNTITFNGHGSIINSTTSPIIAFAGSKYITIDSFNIAGTGAFAGFGIHIGTQSRNITINGNKLNVGTTATATTNAGIVVSGAIGTATTAGNNAQYVTVTNNEITGGYYSVIMMGNTGYLDNYGHNISNNQFKDFYYCATYLANADTVTISGNDMNKLTRTGAPTTAYGMYNTTSRNLKIRNNRIHDLAAPTTGNIGIGFANCVNSVGYETELTNNVIYNTTAGSNGYVYGISGLTTATTGFIIYHNTIDLTAPTAGTNIIRGITFAVAITNVSFKNNIINISGGGTGVKTGIYVTTTSTTFASNYNVIHVNSTANNNVGYWTAARATMTDWRNASLVDSNSLSLNPVFANAAIGNLAPLSANIDNMGTPLGVTTDLANNPRSVGTPDIGAYEFTGISGDIALTAGSLHRANTLCYSNADTVKLTIQNMIGSTIDFGLNPLTINWAVTGPVNSSGTINVTTDTLQVGGTKTVFVNTVDRSQPGTYTLTAHIQPNTVNTSGLNDTLTGVNSSITPILSVVQRNFTVTANTDSVTIQAQSPLFPGGAFMITEICHNKNTVGPPTGGWPAWHVVDDYIEITGIPNSDLAGYVLEQWSATALLSTHIFPSGTLLNSTGTAIIAVGTVGTNVSNPANHFYLGNGAYTGTFDSGTTPTGRILKNSSGTIIDAVGYSGNSTYAFPAGANVTTADWSGAHPVSNGTCGLRLIGADVNTPTNWIVVTNAQPQDPNVFNTNVPTPSPVGLTGFTWSLNNNPVDTVARIKVGGFTTPGVYPYVATYTNACGTFYDTVFITATSSVPVTLSKFTATANGNNANLSWTTASERNNSHFEIQRSTDGRTFETIGTVKGSGNSTRVTNYVFTDNRIGTTTTQAHYRLKQVDYNGTSQLSQTATVNFARAKSTVSLHPNPFTGALTLQLTEMGTVQISVANLQGKTLYSNAVETTTNTATLTDLQHLQAGIYFVSITQNGNTTIHKVVKQ